MLGRLREQGALAVNGTGTANEWPDLLELAYGEGVPALHLFTGAHDDYHNIYGPTELTLACTHYRWTPASPDECEHEVVPIGDRFAGMRVKVVEEDLAEVAPERSAAAFMVPPGETELFYRTGDRVRRPLRGAPMTFLGRVDSQIKLNGYRVELGEIEAVMQREGGRRRLSSERLHVEAIGLVVVEHRGAAQVGIVRRVVEAQHRD